LNKHNKIAKYYNVKKTHYTARVYTGGDRDQGRCNLRTRAEGQQSVTSV